jgi:hypothetical protein
VTRRIVAISLFLLALRGTASAQPRTDVVRLANGDSITGEVSRLERGLLQFKTDDAGTINIEWDKVASIEAKGQFEVTMRDGRRFLGSLAAGLPQSIVIGAVGTTSVPTTDVTMIMPIGSSFWNRLDGSLDVGFSYTKSSKLAQLNVNTITTYRKPAFDARLSASGTLTQNGEDGSRDDRGTVQASYIRYHGEHLWVGAGVSFESNESLGLRLRSQFAVVAGPRLVNTNRAQLSIGAGLAVSDERNVEADPKQNLDGVTTVRLSYYTYDRPRTNLDVSFQYFPSLSDLGRQRIQLDSSIKREVWKDVFLAVNMFDTFDSRPPTASADINDVGVLLSFGWSF